MIYNTCVLHAPYHEIFFIDSKEFTEPSKHKWTVFLHLEVTRQVFPNNISTLIKNMQIMSGKLLQIANQCTTKSVTRESC